MIIKNKTMRITNNSNSSKIQGRLSKIRKMIKVRKKEKQKVRKKEKIAAMMMSTKITSLKRRNKWKMRPKDAHTTGKGVKADVSNVRNSSLVGFVMMPSGTTMKWIRRKTIKWIDIKLLKFDA